MERANAEVLPPSAAAPEREPADVVYEPPQVAWEDEFDPAMACSDPLNPDCE